MNTDAAILNPKTCNSHRRQNNRGADADVTCREDDFDLSFGSSELPAIPAPATPKTSETLTAWESIRQAQDAFLRAQTCA